MLTIEIPLKVISEANQREDWRAKYKRKLAQQKEVTAEWKNAIGKRTISLPCVVTLTRIGAKALDSDNLAGSFKHVRDSIAKLLGVDDGSPLVRFEYQQNPIGKREYRIKIEVQSL